MDASELTARQAEILEVIRDHIAEHHRPPSRPELARMLGISSTNAIFKHLSALEKKGAIELTPGSARGIRVKEEGGLPPPCASALTLTWGAFGRRRLGQLRSQSGPHGRWEVCDPLPRCRHT